MVATLHSGGTGLDHPTLVLNKHWSAMNAITARDALKDVAAGKSQIICPNSFEKFNIEQWLELPIPEDEPRSRIIVSAEQDIRVPIVVLNRHDKEVTRRVVHFSRANLWKRDGGVCQYCGEKPDTDALTIDHVVPRCQGGQTTFINTVLACIKCNRKKDGRTPEQAGMKLSRWVEGKDGILIKEFYHRPDAPKWSVMYSVKRKKIPASILTDWAKFIPHLVNELYWNTGLEP